MIASPETEARPVAGAVPVERVSLDNLPKGCGVIFQEVRLNRTYPGLCGALWASFNLSGILRTVYDIGHSEFFFLVNIITKYRQERPLQGFGFLG